MAIKSFTTSLIDPTSASITAPRFSIGSVHNVGIHLVDESGVSGFAYGYVFDAYSAAAIESLFHLLAESYVGTEAAEMRKTRSALLTKKVNFLGVRGLVRLAASVLDMAAWDLHCRMHETNLVHLLGYERTQQPAFTAAAIWAGLSPEESAAAARTVTADLHSPHVKMWVGSSDLAFEYDRVAAVREALEPGAGLIVDVAQAYNWRTAARLAQLLDDLDILWFEDPIEYEDLEGHRRFAEEAPMPMGTGEHFYGLDQLKAFLDTGAMQYAVLDLERIGGITDFLAAAALCEAYRVDLVNHCHPHTSAQLLATAKAGSWFEIAPLWDDFFGVPTVVDGLLQVDMGAAGIGLEPPGGAPGQKGASR